MNRRTDTWRNRCFGIMDDHPVHISPNHYILYQNGCSSKNFSSNHPCCQMASAHCANSSDILCLPVCLILLLCPRPLVSFRRNSQSTRPSRIPQRRSTRWRTSTPTRSTTSGSRPSRAAARGPPRPSSP